MSLVERMEQDLLRARKARDRAAVAALRTTLAAFANAAAPPADGIPASRGAVEHARLVLTDDDHQRILSDEIADREDTIERFIRGGQLAAAGDLRAELAVLRGYES